LFLPKDEVHVISFHRKVEKVPHASQGLSKQARGSPSFGFLTRNVYNNLAKEKNKTL